MTPFAHTTAGPPDEWESLPKHLAEVAHHAARLADTFDAGDWGRIAGRWHDIGKYSAAFQAYLHRSAAARQVATSSHTEADDPSAESLTGRVDHSTAGAQHAASTNTAAGRLLAAIIAGHHAGLADRGGVEQPGSLEARLSKRDPVIGDALARAPREALAAPVPLNQLRPPFTPSTEAREAGFEFAFFTRMVFSALVDADYLATEAFASPERSAERLSHAPQTGDVGLFARLSGAIVREIDARSSRPQPASVAHCRSVVARDCRAAADRRPGFFTLTVPTGGGKTLSSMLFALEHARQNGLRRVIVAVPFTSIIDQNALVYREALGAEHVLEHHSNLQPDRETPWRRLTTENWDAPVVVTTTVQFFESPFANRPSACRKLHNLARSVIVLDEAQTMPVTLLAPILRALRELVDHYGCTLVLCTATQPALGARDGFPIGLPLGPTNEIIAEVPALFRGLKRTAVAAVGARADHQVADRLMQSDAALAIVNTRRHAAFLFSVLREQDPSALHLSALMCPAHRTAVLAEIHRRLKDGHSCRVVSTQVVEAGVDLDFPLVLRSMAGLDSIAQSAGRCNREGLLACGRVEVFEPDADAQGGLPSSIRHAIDAASQVIPDHLADPISPEAIEAYFRVHYWKQSSRWDARRVLECFTIGPGHHGGLPILDLNFASAADRFVMIDDAQRGVVVPYTAEGRQLIDEILGGKPPTRDLRSHLQRFSVNLSRWLVRKWLDVGLISDDNPAGIAVLADPKAYDDQLGVLFDRDGIAPETLCC